MGDWSGLQAVELVELAGEGSVGYEMVDVAVSGGHALGFVDKGRGASEGVMSVADQGRVREGFTAELCRKISERNGLGLLTRAIWELENRNRSCLPPLGKPQ